MEPETAARAPKHAAEPVPEPPSAAAPARARLLEFIGQLLSAVDWRWILLPPLLLALEMGAVYFWLLDGGRTLKDALEALSLVLLWSAVALGLLRSFLVRKRFWLWLTLLLAALLFREYHLLKASTTIVYLTLAMLGVGAWRSRVEFAPYLRNRRFMTALMLMSFSYVLTQTLDIDAFKQAHGVFGLTEEMMELTGHVFALIGVLVAGPAPSSGDGPIGRA